MKRQFLKELNHELVLLKKAERKKYIDDYEEVILDKMENGITEEEAVSNLGDVKQLAKDILNSYAEQDGKTISNNKNYFNGMYMFYDGIVLTVSYLLAYYLCFKGIIGQNLISLSFSIYISALIYVIPVFLIIYYSFKLYTLKCTRDKITEIRNIILANVVGLFTFTFLLYLFRQFLFSRMMVAVFVCINVVLEIITRKFISNKTVDFGMKVWLHNK